MQYIGAWVIKFYTKELYQLCFFFQSVDIRCQQVMVVLILECFRGITTLVPLFVHQIQLRCRYTKIGTSVQLVEGVT